MCYFFICNMQAQERIVDNLNQVNTKGEKEGFWIDSTKYRKTEKYYKDGKLFGIYKRVESLVESGVAYVGGYFAEKLLGWTAKGIMRAIGKEGGMVAGRTTTAIRQVGRSLESVDDVLLTLHCCKAKLQPRLKAY